MKRTPIAIATCSAALLLAACGGQLRGLRATQGGGAHQNVAFGQVAQLPHVAGPVVLHEGWTPPKKHPRQTAPSKAKAR